MKYCLRSLFFWSAMFLLSSALHAQDVTGIWRGYFVTDNGEQYKYEVQLGQAKTASLTGVTYSYLDTRFYGKAAATGYFTKATKTALVQETKTVELRMASGSVSCIMKCRLAYSVSGKEEFLEGSYVSTYEKTDDGNNVRRGGDCGGGRVFLRKVTTTDFYEEPFIKSKRLVPVAPVKKPLVRKPPVIPPPARRPVVKKSVVTPLQKNAVVKRPVIKKLPVADTVKSKIVGPVAITRPVKKLVIPVVTRDRKNETAKAIEVENREVQIRLYDNGEIDDDTVSVYLDGAMVLASKRLSNTPITYTLKLDPASPEHTLTMVAENMGRYPPNTSLMIIDDGDKRYQVNITSTEQKNAMVRFRLKE